ncbi:MAG: hypothetical protein OSJ68_03880 [Clostridia bacterium]|nr:hypothetical protein [Clostridia bacterium]
MSGRSLKGEVKATFNSFRKKLKKEYDATEGNKLTFEQLTENHYGWAFPALKSNINLKRIAENCDALEAFETFGKLSYSVHSNTLLQNFTSRMEDTTYKIVSYAIEIMGEYVLVFMENLRLQKRYVREFLTMYDDLRSEITSYFTDLAQKLKEFL